MTEKEAKQAFAFDEAQLAYIADRIDVLIAGTPHSAFEREIGGIAEYYLKSLQKKLRACNPPLSLEGWDELQAYTMGEALHEFSANSPIDDFPDSQTEEGIVAAAKNMVDRVMRIHPYTKFLLAQDAWFNADGTLNYEYYSAHRQRLEYQFDAVTDDPTIDRREQIDRFIRAQKYLYLFKTSLALEDVIGRAVEHYVSKTYPRTEPPPPEVAPDVRATPQTVLAGARGKAQPMSDAEVHTYLQNKYSSYSPN